MLSCRDHRNNDGDPNCGFCRDHDNEAKRVAGLEEGLGGMRDKLVMERDRRIEAEKDARDERAAKDKILSLIRSTKMKHGTCQPREQKACTNCNAQEDLDAILADWKGPQIYLASKEGR